MRRFVGLGLALIAAGCASPVSQATPSIAFITPAPSVTGDACWLVPDLTVLSGRPNPIPEGFHLGNELTCSWMYGPREVGGPYDGFLLGVGPADALAALKAIYDKDGPPTTVLGLGDEAYYWTQIGAPPSRPSYLVARAGMNTLFIEIAVGDRARDRDIAVAVTQAAIERLQAAPLPSWPPP